MIQGEPAFSESQLEKISQLIEPWFIFSLVWSVGGTTDNVGRQKFDSFLRAKMKEENVRFFLTF